MKMKIVLLCWAAVLGGAFAEKKNSSLEDELKNFHIPGATLDEADFRTVIDALENSYQKYSKVVPEVGREFTIEVSEAFEAKISGKIPSQSLLATLYQVAGQAGCSLSFADTKVTLNPIPISKKAHEFQLLVHPNFIEQFARRADIPIFQKGDLPEPYLTLQADSLKKAFTDLGLFVDDETRVSYEQKSARLVVSATKHERQRIETFLKSMEQAPKQIRVVSRLITGSSGLHLEIGEFSPLEVQTMVRAASRVKGTEFLTLSSLVMLPGNSAHLETIGNDALFDDDAWTGSKLHFELDLRGRAILGELQYKRRVKVPGAEGKVEERSLLSAIALRDQDTLVQKIITKDGSADYLMTTIEVIDATGRRVEDRSLMTTTQPSSK